MIPILFVLFSLLDIQRPVIVADGMEKKFVVSELVEASLTGCAENPQGGGGFNGDPLTVNWLKAPEPTDSNVTSTWFADGVSATENDLKTNPSLAKIFRQVFRKAAYCRGCAVCSANCRNGCISFENEP